MKIWRTFLFPKSIKCFVIFFFFSLLGKKLVINIRSKLVWILLIVSVYTINFEILKEEKMKMKRKKMWKSEVYKCERLATCGNEVGPTRSGRIVSGGQSVFPARAKREEVFVPRSLPPAATGGSCTRAISRVYLVLQKKKKRSIAICLRTSVYCLSFFGLYFRYLSSLL